MYFIDDGRADPNFPARKSLVCSVSTVLQKKTKAQARCFHLRFDWSRQKTRDETWRERPRDQRRCEFLLLGIDAHFETVSMTSPLAKNKVQ